MKYTCDDCGEPFSHPVWHCLCGEHNWYTVKRCACGQECHLPAEWLLDAAEIARGWAPPATTKPPLPPVKDAKGTTVPPKLVPVFKDVAKEMRAWIQAIGRVRSKVAAMTKMSPEGSQVLREERKEALGLLSRLTAVLYGSVPAELHSGCAGAGCMGCHHRGWIPNHPPKRAPRRAVSTSPWRQAMLWDFI